MVVLEEKYGVPPFSILDTRLAYWTKRRNEWNTLGIKSDLGRNSINDPVSMSRNDKWLEKKGLSKIRDESNVRVSIFDPVLCELIYKWFCPINGKILDPFAGGSVRGIVASKLNFNYTGVDLRDEQILANIDNFNELDNLQTSPNWICSDSMNIDKLGIEQSDLLFSCPPYHDLEIYSDNMKDISNMNYKDFLTNYEVIIKKSIGLLKNNRFAVFVVGEIRDEDGFYKNFIHDTISIFIRNGMKFYNDIILVGSIGSMSLRVDQWFSLYRKVGKIHQNVLVFYKGDPKTMKPYDIPSPFFQPLDIKYEKRVIDRVLTTKTDVIMCDICNTKCNNRNEYDMHLTRPFHLNSI